MMIYLVAVVAGIELCLLIFRSGRLTMAGAMKRAMLASVLTGIIYGFWLKPEGDDPGLTLYQLMIVLIIFVMAMIPATALALLWMLLFGRSREN